MPRGSTASYSSWESPSQNARCHVIWQSDCGRRQRLGVHSSRITSARSRSCRPRRHRRRWALMTSSTCPARRFAKLRCHATGCTPLINAQSSSVLRLNRRPLARISFTITFMTASPSETAAAGDRRRMDGSITPRCMPVESMVLPQRIAATNDGVRRLVAGRGSPSWSTSSEDDTPSFERRVHLHGG